MTLIFSRLLELVQVHFHASAGSRNTKTHENHATLTFEAFVRRGIRCGFCYSDNRTIQQLVEESDQSLFKRVLNDNYHVLNCLLPDERHYCYNLRDRGSQSTQS